MNTIHDKIKVEEGDFCTTITLIQEDMWWCIGDTDGDKQIWEDSNYDETDIDPTIDPTLLKEFEKLQQEYRDHWQKYSDENRCAECDGFEECLCGCEENYRRRQYLYERGCAECGGCTCEEE
jgi:hypothetical protein